MKYQVTINGQMFDVTVEAVSKSTAVKKPIDLDSTNAQVVLPDEVKAQQEELVKSPMPGSVWEIKSAPGDRVEAGQTLLILEAMKMENEIVAPRDGIVKQVLVAKGTTVEANQVLFVLS